MIVKEAGMSDLERQRAVLARAEAGIALSMRQPTMASRGEAMRREYDGMSPDDRPAFLEALIFRVSLMDR